MRWMLLAPVITIMALAVVRHLLSQVREFLLTFASVISAWREVRRTLSDGEAVVPLPDRGVARTVEGRKGQGPAVSDLSDFRTQAADSDRSAAGTRCTFAPSGVRSKLSSSHNGAGTAAPRRTASPPASAPSPSESSGGASSATAVSAG